MYGNNMTSCEFNH